jgi:D-glycero-alpha-D-manno-heptose 1-phosphate guanylyltransferase
MNGLENVTAVILAGGLGTRLREVVADRPKVLAEVNGRPFLACLLDRLADGGIGRVVLCTGYMAEMISDAFGNGYRGMDLLYSREEEPLGTGGALRLALPQITSDPVLVMNGDSFCDADLGLFARQHHESGARASLVLAKVADVARYGVVDSDPSGAISSFQEKGSRTGAGMINAGIYLLASSVIAAIPEQQMISLEREVFPPLIGHGLYGFLHKSRFIDIGIPSDYQAAAAIICDSKHAASSGVKP